ncbi:MAG: hypothetical protein KatS3mg027_1406 [Bacteroidia bacterium]|nr:MAG: hypothetical protein KatS3mg027_1406 [Bacteroidia bacterium]
MHLKTDLLHYPFYKDPFPVKFSYYFTNRFNDHYEVSFSRDGNNYLKVTISFCVTNDEYENDQYAIINKGDVYRVLNTVCLIILSFSKDHPNVNHYVFSGERRQFEIEQKIEVTGRTRVFLRFVEKFFKPPEWEVKQEGNFVHLLKKY